MGLSRGGRRCTSLGCLKGRASLIGDGRGLLVDYRTWGSEITTGVFPAWGCRGVLGGDLTRVEKIVGALCQKG